MASYSLVTIKVYDINGNLIDEILNNYLYPGKHDVKWDSLNEPSGLYFIKINNGHSILTSKVSLIK